MRHRIVYSDPMRYYLDDKEVSEEQYKNEVSRRESKRLCEMLSECSPPQGISDCTFMKGHDNGSQFSKSPHMGNYYRHITERNGGSVKGKRYLSGLARYPGDPEAWVGGRDEVKSLVEKRGWGCEGTVNVKAREAENPPEQKTEVAEDLLNKYTLQVASSLPDPERIDLVDLKKQVKERIKPKKNKK